MVNPELIDYIKSVKRQGHSHDAIRAHLVKHGYTHDMVDEALAHPEIIGEKAQAPGVAIAPTKHHQARKDKNYTFLLVVVGIFMLGSGVFFVYQFMINNQIYSDECKEVSLKIHEVKDNRILCVYSDNSKIQTILKNDGAIAIKDAVVTLKGEKGSAVRNLDNLNLKPGDISMHVIDYGAGYGGLKDVSVQPIIEIEGKKYSCKEFRFYEIAPC